MLGGEGWVAALEQGLGLPVLAGVDLALRVDQVFGWLSL